MVINNNNNIEFLNEHKLLMTRENILLIYNENKINNDKCELFSDFIRSLFLIIFDTYVGDDFMNAEQRINHFRWCWNKNKNNFEKEGFVFNDNNIYTYFLDFMVEIYYPSTAKDNPATTHRLLSLWSHVLNYSNQKTKADVDFMVNVYGILDKSLIKK